MITKIYLVRHTRTIGNDEKRLTGREDYPVTEDGQRYIDAVTERLKDIRFDAVYSSTTGRSIKTIRSLAERSGLDIETTDELCEMYFGIYDGWKWEDVNKVNPAIKEGQNTANEIMGIPEQESTEVVADRMYACIRRIAMENPGKTILIGSHGVAIEAFLRRVTGEPFLVKIQEYSQKNTAVNVLGYDTERDCFELKLLNDISHLDRFQVRAGELTDCIVKPKEGTER